MHFHFRPTVLAAALSCTIATPLYAQEAPSTAEEELAAMRTQLEALVTRIDQLEGELAQTQAENVAQETAIAQASEKADAATAAEAAPQATLQKSDGWSFKPRGRLMIDAGTISVPDGVDADDGFGSEARRARLGASGDLPGGFGYKFEFDLADDDIDVNDAILTYGAGNIEIAIGQHNTFQSLEELTSSLHSSFIERAAFTDAFGFERRIGASIEYSNGIFLGQAGVFTDNFADTGTDNRSVDGRVVLMPKLGDAQLHLGGSLHYNDLGEEDATVRYRQRPFVHFTSSRFVNTDGIDAESEFGTGLEAAVIAGPFHASAEGFWQKVDTPLEDNPTFFGGYAEVGYFLTAGDSRGYKGGTFDRVKPTNPLGDGGFGSLQINLRYDHLDLSDAGIIGGIQDGYQASLLWKPAAYTLLSINYGRMEYTDAVLPTPDGDTDYGVDAFGIRAQVDF